MTLHKGRGRPTKLTNVVIERILIAIRAGNYLETAARYAGIDNATFRRWMVKGESPDAPLEFRDFCEAIKRTRAEAEVRAVALIQRAADGGTWQAAAWYLERSYPDRWGRNRVEINGADNAAIRVDIDADALEAKVRALVAQQGARLTVSQIT